MARSGGGGGNKTRRNGDVEAEGSKFHGAANRVTDYDVDRLRETTKLDKLKERNLRVAYVTPIKLSKI